MKHLFNDYYLDKDKYNYIILERTITKKKGMNQGKEKFTPVSYFGTSIQALKNGIARLYTLEHLFNKEIEELMYNLDKILRMIDDEI